MRSSIRPLKNKHERMKKTLGLVIALTASFFLFAQDPTGGIQDNPAPTTVDTLPIIDPSIMAEESRDGERKKSLDLAQLQLATRPKDHLLIQVGYDSWARKPDSINMRGFSRSFNMYFMFDFPFKTNPKLSVAAGAGISTSNIYFKDTYIDITGRDANRLSFQDVSDTTHFKKYKLMTTFLEAPIELRYTKDPANPKKSLKAALGVKVGTMLSATTKGKTLLNSSGNTVNAYTQKEKAKRFFNGTRLSLTGRVGLGSLSVFGSYQFNAFVKEGMGPDVRPYSIGLTLSGL